MAEADLRNMIMNFRVSDLQVLLGFAGRNKTGKKQELQSRALDLVKLKSPAVEMKVKELHNRRYHHQLHMTRPNSYDIPDRTLTDRPISNYESAMNNNYTMRSNTNIRPMAMNQSSIPSYPGGKPYLSTVSSQIPFSSYADVKFKELPFYDTLHVLMRPFMLAPNPVDRCQESTYTFTLSPQEAHDLAVSKDSSGNYECQVLLRFCVLEAGTEQDDNFPPSVSLKVNGKNVSLPNPVPTNRPGVEPKRPSKSVNLTPFTKLSPTVTNVMSITWSSQYGRSYAAVLYIARLLSAYTLLQRLKNRGMRMPEHTKAMIVDKLQGELDSEIATTSMQASLICPLGKLKMELPCRAITCTHIPCFDALLYIQLNEKKPKWRCPVCDKPALFKTLVLDGLFMEIVAKVPPECTDVKFHEDGSWSPIMPTKDKETKKTVIEQSKKSSSSDSVEVVDISSDEDTDDAWKTPKITNADTPPLMYLPPDPNLLVQCPSPPVTAFSPVSSSMTDFASSNSQPLEPLPLVLTSNVQSKLDSPEQQLEILPDLVPSTGNLTPSLDLMSHTETAAACASISSVTSPTYLPYPTTSDSAMYCTNASDTFHEHAASEAEGQSCESYKSFDFYSLLETTIPESEHQRYEKSLADKIANPDIISIE